MDYQKHLGICRAATNGPHYEFFSSFARNNIEQYITRCMELKRELQLLTAENKRLRDALDEIVDLIKFMQIEANELGAKIHGQKLFNDPNYLKEIAKKPLGITP